MSQPLVSCIIPCYNRAGLVRLAIDSVLAQTYPSIEIITVDDGSTDSTLDVLRSYGSRITVISQKNGGTAAARNAGIRAASGQYLAWLDSDDCWVPEKTELQVAALERYPDVDQVYSGFVLMDMDGNPPLSKESLLVPDAAIRKDTLAMLIVESEAMPSSSMVRRSALDEVGYFDPEFDWEDWELNFRLGRRHDFAYIDAPLMRYRVHDSSKTSDLWLHSQGMLQLRKKFEDAREEILASSSGPALKEAYRKHQLKYADAYYRFGKSALSRGDILRARYALAQAVRLNPRVFKYHTRRMKANVMGMLRPTPDTGQSPLPPRLRPYAEREAT